MRSWSVVRSTHTNTKIQIQKIQIQKYKYTNTKYTNVCLRYGRWAGWCWSAAQKYRARTVRTGPQLLQAFLTYCGAELDAGVQKSGSECYPGIPRRFLVLPPRSKSGILSGSKWARPRRHSLNETFLCSSSYVSRPHTNTALLLSVCDS